MHGAGNAISSCTLECTATECHRIGDVQAELRARTDWRAPGGVLITSSVPLSANMSATRALSFPHLRAEYIARACCARASPV